MKLDRQAEAKPNRILWATRSLWGRVLSRRVKYSDSHYKKITLAVERTVKGKSRSRSVRRLLRKKRKHERWGWLHNTLEVESTAFANGLDVVGTKNEESRLIPRCLAWATRWMTAFTEMGKTGGKIGLELWGESRVLIMLNLWCWLNIQMQMSNRCLQESQCWICSLGIVLRQGP